MVIPKIDEELAKSCADLLKGKILVHCSGVLSAKEGFKKCSLLTDTVSLHPMLALNSKRTSTQTVQNCFFTLEGSEKGVETLGKILKKMGLSHTV